MVIIVGKEEKTNIISSPNYRTDTQQNNRWGTFRAVIDWQE